MAEKKEKKKFDAALYSMEAYYSMSESLFPMSKFASELLEARTEAEISEVCKRYKFQHPTYSPYANPRHFIRGTCNDWRFKPTDDFVPSYTSWLFDHMKTISACLQLYAVCLPIARGTTKNSKTTDIFDMLYHAHQTYQQMVSEVHHNCEWIQIEDLRERRLKFWLRKTPRFPLVKLFDAFQQEVGYGLQVRYGHQFKQMRRRGESSPPRSQYHYWQNPTAVQEAKDSLWKYTYDHPTEYDSYIFKRQAQELAEVYLHVLDRYISDELGSVRLELDSKAGTAKLVTRGGLESALHLWLFTQIQAQTDYRVCKMCGRLFIPGTQKGKKYCGLHEKHEINYYNKTIGRLGSASGFEISE